MNFYKKMMMLCVALVGQGCVSAVNAQEMGNHKAYVYTELQFSTPFDAVPWQKMNPNLKQVPGLINKTWLSGTDGSPGGFYVFDSLEHAQNFVTTVFPEEARGFGVAQTTRIFNAQNTQEASTDMGSVFFGGVLEKEPEAFVYTEVQVSYLNFNRDVDWKKRNPALKEIKGLINKTWLSGVHTGTIGGFYAFDSFENAKDFTINIFPEVAKEQNAAFYTRLFDARVTKEASMDMGSPFYR